MLSRTLVATRWLRVVGSLKSQVSFAEYHLFYRALLQKRTIILRSLPIVGTPYSIRHRFMDWMGSQHNATHCSKPQHTATHCNTLQYTAIHCNTQCNTLQHIVTHRTTMQNTVTHCNTLQHTTTHRSTLHHTATHCKTPPNFQLSHPLTPNPTPCVHTPTHPYLI